MKAAIIVAPRKVEIREVEAPKPADGQVLVRTRCAAICGSDHPFFQGIQTYRKPPLPPGHPGHETIGVVVESRTPDFAPGDAVIAIPKGDCGFAEYFVADAAPACKLPQGHEGDEMVVAQPLATVVRACRRLGYSPHGEMVRSTHPTPSTSWGLRDGVPGSAMRIIAVDLLANRLAVARQVGATDTVDASQQDPVAEVTKLTGGKMADLVVEAVGFEETLSTCLRLARTGGEAFAFGVPRYPVYQFPMREYFRRQLTMHCAVNLTPREDFPVAFDLLLSGAINPKPLITHRIPFSDLQRGFEMAVDRRDGAIKVLVEFER